jgi:cell division protein FtsI (penicillin-binding protein 3)
MSGRYVTSFVGFMPADDPKFSLLVLLDDPTMKEGTAFGGVVAGPVFARIAEKAARYLDLRPTEPIPPLPGTNGSKKVALSVGSRD